MDTLLNSSESKPAAVSFDALAKALHYAIRAVEAGLGADAPLAGRFVALRERLEVSRLQLAVLGQFKRGKSTFINALIGVPLLPVAVVPLTAVPVFIAWRKAPLVRVHFRDGRPPEELAAREPRAIRDFLFGFVAEEANPKNRLGVGRVELFFPAAIIADGTVLIDTPGVGSTFKHNTESAFEVLPECDAAIFVVSADPPITDIELEYLRRIMPQAARVFYVLNKVDYLDDPVERDRVTAFLREVLETNRLWGADSRIFSVSARDALQARQDGKEAEFAASGMAEVEKHLIHQLAADKSLLLQAALTTKVRDVLAQGIAELSLRTQTLQLPLDRLVEKSAAFEKSIRSIEERRRVARDLLTGQWRNLHDEIERSIDVLRKEASSELAQLLDDQLATQCADAAAGALSAAVGHIFDRASDRLVPTFSKRVLDVLANYREGIDADVDAVRRTAAGLFHTSFSASGELAPFRLGLEPYWVTQAAGARLIPDPTRWIERLLPRALRQSRIRARMLGRIDELVVRNAENLRWALLRGLDETFREASATLQECLNEAVAATHGVIQEALTRRRDVASAIDADLQRLNHASKLLMTLQRQLTATQHEIQSA